MTAPARADVPGTGLGFVARAAMALLLAVCLAVTLARPAQTAEIGVSNKPGCLFELTGPIVSGDAERFRRLAAQHWAIDWEGRNDNAGSALCLDSRGGSFLEGNAIANDVHERAIATRIGPGAECLSACSLVFMAGRNLATEIDRYRRILHVTGHLGFHAPYTDLEEARQTTGQEVNTLVRDLNDLIADFLRHASFRSFTTHRPSVSMGLLVEMMDMPKGDLFMIDTVERAARWGVELDGVGGPPQFTLLEYVQLCDNQFAWMYDGASERVQGDLSWLRYETVRKPMQTGPEDFIVFDRGGMAPMRCEIELLAGAETGTGLCLSDGFTGVGLGNCNDPSMPNSIWVPWWHAMPPDMPLSALR